MANQVISDEQQAQTDIQRLVQAIEAHPEQWQAYADLIGVLTATGSFVEAEELGLKSLTLFDQNHEAKAYLAYAVGNMYYTAGSYEQAQSFFQMVDNAALKHDVTMMQAQDWYAQKNYKKALAFALTGIEQDQEDIAAFNLLGNIWLALNQFTSAQTSFDQALKLDAQNFAANFGRGVIAKVNQPDQDNSWLKQAQIIDAAKYEQRTQQFDALLQVMTGGKTEEEQTHARTTK